MRGSISAKYSLANHSFAKDAAGFSLQSKSDHSYKSTPKSAFWKNLSYTYRDSSCVWDGL